MSGWYVPYLVFIGLKMICNLAVVWLMFTNLVLIALRMIFSFAVNWLICANLVLIA